MSAAAPAFSATDAALSGFRLIGRRPGVIAAWALVYLGYQAVLGVLMIGLMGDKLGQLQAMVATNQSDPEAALAMLPSLGLFFVILLALVFVFSAVMNAAVFRALLRPDEPVGFGYLRFGRDEVRMGVLIVLWAALAIGYGFLAVFVFALGVAAGAGLPGAIKPIFYLVWSVGLIVSLIYPAVRLSLSGPMTLAQSHIRIFESWALTRKRFWPLLGAYFLCGVLIFVVLVVGMIVAAIVAAAVALATGGSLASLSGVFQPDYSSLAGFLSPPRLVAMLLNAPVSAMTFAIGVGPSVEAYLALSGPAHAAPPEPYVATPAPEAAPEAPPEPAYHAVPLEEEAAAAAEEAPAAPAVEEPPAAAPEAPEPGPDRS